MSTTTTTFDLERFARAAEARDAATQLAMYAPHATVTIVDKISQPQAPRVLRSNDEIREWLVDICGRDMAHAVQHKVSDGRGAAFTEACVYPDGTNVLCATVIELDAGAITGQTVVQVWDEK
jgi:hypothetical protein